jgi:hypothetical protein
MRSLLRRSVAALVVAGLASSALAQPPFDAPPANLPPPVNPYLPNVNPGSAVIQQPGTLPDAQAQATMPSLRSTVPIFNPAYPPAPTYGGGGYGGWGWGGGGLGFGQNPFQGYMQGAADLTVANAQYQLTIQQAKIVQEQARREAIATRRATQEQMEYEKNDWLRRIDPETQHQKDLERGLRRSMNDPPSSEIWAGISLNALLKDIQNAQSAGVNAPPVPLDPEWLPHINLTTGVTTAGVGMLKDMTRFKWPQSLRKKTFEKERTQIEELTRQIVSQARGGKEIDADLLDKLTDAVDGMEQRIQVMAPDLTPSQIVQSSRYVHELKDSLKVLMDPNAANYFNDKWKAQGDTVDQLVAYMTGQGLHFAAATSGDEPSYTALHRAMVTYVSRLKSISGQ